MPFTPFHMGPGLALKATMPRNFSLCAFAFSQFLMDLESLYNLIEGRWPVHAYFHTYVGATWIALATIWMSRYVLSPLLRLWNSLHGRGQESRLFVGDGITWRAAACGAFLGAYSHVVLDSIMHSDIQPLAPWNSANPLHHLMSVSLLHGLCVLSGLIGGAGLLFLMSVRRLPKD